MRSKQNYKPGDLVSMWIGVFDKKRNEEVVIAFIALVIHDRCGGSVIDILYDGATIQAWRSTTTLMKDED